MKLRNWLVLACLATSSTAFAADHIMKVDEVLLNGGNNEQFVELHDTSAEALPNGPYNLRIYNSSGTMTETVALTGITAGATVYYAVGNAAAKTTYGAGNFSATLTMDLPNPGQACFERSDNTRTHCLAWGCTQTFVTPAPGAQVAEPPTSGMSLSRPVAGGPVQAAAPTPKAANSAGTNAVACPVPDAGVTPDANNGNNADAGTGGGGGDDDSGCCQSSTPARTTGGAVLAMLVLGSVLRRRRARR